MCKNRLFILFTFLEQDKSQQTDGSGPALFNLFNKRVKENLHIIFAMSPLSPEFGAFIASKLHHFEACFLLC